MRVTFRARQTGNIPWLGTDVEDDRLLEPWNLMHSISAISS